MSEPTTKAELLSEMGKSHQAFLDLLKHIPEERMSEIALYDNWSIKDLVAHMLGWYELTLERVAAARRGDTPRKFADYNYDPFNAEIKEQYYRTPLAEIRQLEADRFMRLTQIVENGDQAELFDVERYPHAGRSIASYMMSSTIQHYDDHLDDVRAWMKTNGLEKPMSKPTTKAELLSEMGKSHQAFLDLLKHIPEERMTEIALYDAWTIKDLIAHVGWWEQSAANRVLAYRSGTRPWLDATVDQINERILKQRRDHPLEQVRQFEMESFANLRAEVEKASDAELFEPDHFKGRDGEPLYELVAGDTYEHYPEHMEDVRAWMRQNELD